MEKLSSKFILFYFVIIYVFAFLFWWSYLLYDKTEQHYIDTLKYESLKYEFESNSSSVKFTETEDFQKLYSKFKRQKNMVIMEGTVFFLILLVGMLKIRQSFMKEIEMANQQRNFILSITHELKSPLSSIKLMSETLVKRDLPKEKQNQLLGNSLEEVDRLESLVENVLLAAKIDNNKYGFTKEKQNFSHLLKHLCENFEISKKRNLKMNIEDNIEIVGDKSALASIISNLLENAYKYGPEWSYIEVNLRKKESVILFSVADFGQGIKDKEKQKVFEKFYRVGNEDTRLTKGTGLGLYIVKKIGEFHNGTIKIEDHIPNGTIFKMEFKPEENIF